MWAISPPSQQNLIKSLNATSGNTIAATLAVRRFHIEIDSKVICSRESTNGNLYYTEVTKLEEDQEQTLAKILQAGHGSMTILNFFPRFIRLPGSTGSIT